MSSQSKKHYCISVNNAVGSIQLHGETLTEAAGLRFSLRTFHRAWGAEGFPKSRHHRCSVFWALALHHCLHFIPCTTAGCSRRVERPWENVSPELGTIPKMPRGAPAAGLVLSLDLLLSAFCSSEDFVVVCMCFCCCFSFWFPYNHTDLPIQESEVRLQKKKN